MVEASEIPGRLTAAAATEATLRRLQDGNMGCEGGASRCIRKEPPWDLRGGKGSGQGGGEGLMKGMQQASSSFTTWGRRGAQHLVEREGRQALADQQYDYDCDCDCE